jgi:hypothetical protein
VNMELQKFSCYQMDVKEETWNNVC